MSLSLLLGYECESRGHRHKADVFRDEPVQVLPRMDLHHSSDHMLPFANQLLEQGNNNKKKIQHCSQKKKKHSSLFSSLQALDNFNTAVISPVYYVMFTTFTILASMIMFKVKMLNGSYTIRLLFVYKDIIIICLWLQDWASQSGLQIATELCGFVTILSGTFLLHKTKDMGNSANTRGATSQSPRETPVFINSGSTRSSNSSL